MAHLVRDGIELAAVGGDVVEASEENEGSLDRDCLLTLRRTDGPDQVGAILSTPLEA